MREPFISREKAVQVELADQLNRRMCSVTSIYSAEAIALARNFERPIVVDFNNVLVNSSRPWTPNPKAIPAMRQLTQMGTIVVATSAWGSWELRQQALQDFGLWRQGMILVTAENMLISEDVGKMLIKEMEERLNRPLSKAEKSNVYYANKILSPVFGKSFDVPIIDDDPSNTINNPGMLGLLVKAFDPTPRTIRFTEGMKTLTMDEAVARVAAHYS